MYRSAAVYVLGAQFFIIRVRLFVFRSITIFAFSRFRFLMISIVIVFISTESENVSRRRCCFQFFVVGWDGFVFGAASVIF